MRPDEIKKRDQEIFNAESKTDIFHSSDLALIMKNIELAWFEGWIKKHPSFSNGLVSVDVGCGGGYNTIWSCNFSKLAIGIDHSKKRIINAKKNLPKGVDAVFIIGDGEFPPVKKNSVDIIMCFAILHNLPNYRSSLEFLFDCLKPNGMIICIEPCAYNPFAVIRRKFFPSDTHTPNEKPFSPNSLVKLFNELYDDVIYKRKYLLSINSQIIEKLFGKSFGLFYFRLFNKMDEFLLKLPIIKHMCWRINIIGFKNK